LNVLIIIYGTPKKTNLFLLQVIVSPETQLLPDFQQMHLDLGKAKAKKSCASSWLNYTIKDEQIWPQGNLNFFFVFFNGLWGTRAWNLLCARMPVTFN